MRKCPSLCSGPGHGLDPLLICFLELLLTLGQLDGTGRAPLGPATS